MLAPLGHPDINLLRERRQESQRDGIERERENRHVLGYNLKHVRVCGNHTWVAKLRLVLFGARACGPATMIPS